MGLPTVWNANQYSANLHMLVQQKGSRLKNTVYLSPDGFSDGEYKFVDQIGKGAMVEVTNRLGNTEWTDPDAERRRIGKQYYEYAKIFDTWEKLNRLNDPTSKEMLNAVYAVGRQWDSMIITGMTATANAGKAGATSTTLASYDSGNNVIAHGSAGLTLTKLRTTLYRFNQADVPEDETKWFVIAAKEVDNLLGITQLTSADYNSVKTLVEGKVSSFMGFNFIMCNLLTVASSIRTCLAYTESAFELAIAKDMDTTVDRLPERRNSIGLQTQMAGGGVRLEEEKVVSIACDETA